MEKEGTTLSFRSLVKFEYRMIGNRVSTKEKRVSSIVNPNDGFKKVLKEIVAMLL